MSKFLIFCKNIFRILRGVLFPIKFFVKSYSQEGEDMVLNRIFNPYVNLKGFYIDIGAHHPKRFSNTYHFYKLGWKGINIDAMPGSMSVFFKQRPLDINLEMPISNSGKELVYYKFNEPALNGFSKELSELRENESNAYFIEDEVVLKTYKLSDVLEKYVPKNTEIDFMTIDVEGLDFDVLHSNDWDKYRPKVILVEILENSLENFFTNEVYLYLKERDYQFYAKTVNTVLFRRNDFSI